MKMYISYLASRNNIYAHGDKDPRDYKNPGTVTKLVTVKEPEMRIMVAAITASLATAIVCNLQEDSYNMTSR